MKETKEVEPIEKRIPKASFIVPCYLIQENIIDACRKEGSQNILAALDQQHNKYRLVESQLQRNLYSTNAKVPEIEKTLQMIDSLKIQGSTQCLR